MNNTLIYKSSIGKYTAVVFYNIETNPQFEKIVLDDACEDEYGDLQPNQFINAESNSVDLSDVDALLELTVDGTHTLNHDTLETCIEKLIDSRDPVILTFLTA